MECELMTRRQLIAWMAMAGLESSIARGAAQIATPSAGGWQKYAGNPVLGGQYGTCFDICVLREQGKFYMWVSWRPKKSVALSESADGIHW